jgi:methylated-DNA-protein-cysteine methyltransferase-like protein
MIQIKGVMKMSGPVFSAFYSIVRRIPEGKVATYGQIALLAGMPRSARAVGYALASCPQESNIPCHRVVDRLGRTKAAFDILSPGTQRALLEAESIVFRNDGTVDMALCQWNPEKPISF